MCESFDLSEAPNIRNPFDNVVLRSWKRKNTEVDIPLVRAERVPLTSVSLFVIVQLQTTGSVNLSMKSPRWRNFWMDTLRSSPLPFSRGACSRCSCVPCTSAPRDSVKASTTPSNARSGTDGSMHFTNWNSARSSTHPSSSGSKSVFKTDFSRGHSGHMKDARCFIDCPS